MPPKKKPYCGIYDKPPKGSKYGTYSQCAKDRQVRLYGVYDTKQPGDEEIHVVNRNKQRAAARKGKPAPKRKPAKKKPSFDEEEEYMKDVAEKHEASSEDLAKATTLEDFGKRLEEHEKALVGNGLMKRRARGGTIGKSHSSYDYNELWNQLGSGASSGGARKRKRAGAYSGGYVEDIHEMDIHKGAGRRKKRKAGAYSGGVHSGGVLVGGAKKRCKNPWMTFLAAFRKKHKSKYVGNPTKLVKDAGILYRKHNK